MIRAEAPIFLQMLDRLPASVTDPFKDDKERSFKGDYKKVQYAFARARTKLAPIVRSTEALRKDAITDSIRDLLQSREVYALEHAVKGTDGKPEVDPRTGDFRVEPGALLQWEKENAADWAAYKAADKAVGDQMNEEVMWDRYKVQYEDIPPGLPSECWAALTELFEIVGAP